jgi:peroxiredoxin (alkyl hydroperoxide reductase subunit C)
MQAIRHISAGRGLSLRGSFIIDPDGVLKAMDIHDNSIGRSSEEILRKLQASKFVRESDGHVCPANWKPGGKTLKPGLDLLARYKLKKRKYFFRFFSF